MGRTATRILSMLSKENLTIPCQRFKINKKPLGKWVKLHPQWVEIRHRTQATSSHLPTKCLANSWTTTKICHPPVLAWKMPWESWSQTFLALGIQVYSSFIRLRIIKEYLINNQILIEFKVPLLNEPEQPIEASPLRRNALPHSLPSRGIVLLFRLNSKEWVLIIMARTKWSKKK